MEEKIAAIVCRSLFLDKFELIGSPTRLLITVLACARLAVCVFSMSHCSSTYRDPSTVTGSYLSLTFGKKVTDVSAGDDAPRAVFP